MKRRYLGHVTGYQPIRDQHFLIQSIHAPYRTLPSLSTQGENTEPTGGEEGGDGSVLQFCRSRLQFSRQSLA